MRRSYRWLIIVGVLVLIGGLAYGPAAAKWKERNRVKYREAEVTRGKIVAVVNSTGTIKPVRSVQVGTFVSGPILSILVDFNSEVKKGDLLAKIDPRIYEASAARDKAALATQKANVEQTAARLQQAKNDEGRSLALRAQDKGFISDSEMDKFKFDRISLAAQLAVADAMVLQAKANLDTSLANLEYTEIRSPVDGIVIERKIDPGQTVAATFQTPDLFIVAPDMHKEMLIYASVDETEIGLITSAKLSKRPVRFLVDAYTDDLFEGTIFQIRKNSTTTQNVVTYPVIISAPNPDLKLLPGMTANISFQVGESANTLRVPNAALRFFPLRDQVRPEDRPILEGLVPAEDPNDQSVAYRSADEKSETRRIRSRRHVWVRDGDFLRAIEIYTGISDSKNTEVISGDVQEGLKLVTGIQAKS